MAQTESSIKEIVGWYRLLTGWFAYETHSHSTVICSLKELACLALAFSPWPTRPQDDKAS